MKETDLYWPIKAFLEDQGYEVKAEVIDCDVVAVRNDEPPLIVELKKGLTIDLLLQGINRQIITDSVYLAIPHGKGRTFLQRSQEAKNLCRRLGLGLLSVRLDQQQVVVHCDPEQFYPRKIKNRKVALLKEFQMRVGDPNVGGQVGQKIMTAYRQDVLRMVHYLVQNGPTRPRDFISQLNIEKAPSILQQDYYGWFSRIERGVYNLSELGLKAAEEYAHTIKNL